MTYDVVHNVRAPGGPSTRCLGVRTLCIIFLLLTFAPQAHAACTDPNGEEGDVVYNGDHNVVQFCTGAAWIAMGGGGGSGGTTTIGTLDPDKWCQADNTGSVINCTVDAPSGGGGAAAIDDLTDAASDYATDHNLFLGSGAGASIQVGGQFNVLIGEGAGAAMSDADWNTAVGYLALTSNTTGANNTAIGHTALSSTVTGGRNTAVGSFALTANTTGSENIGVGRSALAANTTGNENTVVGTNALAKNTEGTGNVGLGRRALFNNTTGSNNTSLGYQAGDNITTGSKNIVIGHDIDAPSAAGSNQMSIGNLIFGTMIDGTGTTVSSGNVGIGTATPTQKLDVAGTVKATNLESRGSAIVIRLNSCGGSACGSYHAVGSWVDTGSYSLTWTTVLDTNPALFTHTGNGHIIVNKGGLYRITQRPMINGPAFSHHYTCPYVNGVLACGSMSDFPYHFYSPAGYWADHPMTTIIELPAGADVTYGYLIPAAVTYWAHDGYTQMWIERLN